MGVRSFYHLARRKFSEGTGFQVRYWTPGELESALSCVGKAKVSVQGYFGLGVLACDEKYLPGKFKAVVRASEVLRKTSRLIPPLKYVADSLWVEAHKT